MNFGQKLRFYELKKILGFDKNQFPPITDVLEQKMDTPVIEEKWDMPLNDLYRLAVAFYKDKNGKILFR